MRAIFKFIKTIFTLILILCILAGLVLSYAFFIEPNRLTTNTVNIENTKVKKDFKIAIFSDTHFGAGYTTEKFNKAIEVINNADVDFVFFIGDLIDNYDQYVKGGGDTDEISQKLSQIQANIGKYAVFGNHDYGGGSENYYEDIMAAGGFKVLVNQSVYISSLNVRITGVDDFLIGYGNTSVVNNLSTDTYNIVLCHEPDVFDKFNKAKLNLMTSGHSHGAQVNVPYLRDKILPSLATKYTKGLYEKESSSLYVNAGLGTTKVNARLFSVPEITFFSISK